MLRAMSTAASGMRAQQTRIDTIANNLANANTAGFKASRVEFQDLLYEDVLPAGGTRADGSVEPVRMEVGHGVRLAASTRSLGEGTVEQTGNPTDFAIEGDGFFQIRMPDGSIAYSRDGSFKVDADRNLVTSAGYRLEPAMTIPQDAVEVSLARDGTVSVLLAGQNDTPQAIGQLELARFANPAGMRQEGGNLMRSSANSGPPLLGQPGTVGYGETTQGFLERSNVQVVVELVDMITAQRAYELNSKAIQVADEMLSTVNGIRR
jgi:flagellar basal-body rod protein FlgG